MNGNDEFIGIVQVGTFLPLVPAPGAGVKLTTIQMQAAVPPETGELDLTEYEGSAIMVRGHGGGDWIYRAKVIDHAGPILTAVVQRLFGPESNLEIATSD